MLKKTSLLVFIFFSLSFIFYLALARSAREPSPAVDATCLGCHEVIQSLRAGSKHASFSCARCHGKLAEHLKDTEKIPETNLELSLCGRCHAFQYETFVSVNLKSRAKVEKATTPRPKPSGRANMNGQAWAARIAICPR